MPTSQPTPKSTARCHHLWRRPGLLPATARPAAWELAAPGLSASTGYHRATEILAPLALGLGAPFWAVGINNQGQAAGHCV